MMFLRFFLAFALFFVMVCGVSESLFLASQRSQNFWLGWVGMFACIFAYGFIIKQIFKGHMKFEDPSNWTPPKKLIWTIAIGLAVLFLFVGFVGCERIDASHVGIKVNMTGGDKGISKTEYVTGWVFYIKTASKIYEFPTFQQHKEYESYEVPTKGGAVFTVHPTFNYNLHAGEVASMFQRYRLSLSQLENGYLKTTMSTAIREVTNTFTVDSILNNQAGYDAAIFTRLNKELTPFFEVTQFTANLTPDPILKKSILDKAKAVQEAQAAIAQKAVTLANADIDIVNARKDSTVRVVLANSEAEAISVKQRALQQSPQYVDLIKAEKWDGKLPSTMLGGGSNTLFSLK